MAIHQLRSYVGYNAFFAHLSNSELKTNAQVRKYYVLRLLKQAGGAKNAMHPLPKLRNSLSHHHKMRSTISEGKDLISSLIAGACNRKI